MKKILPHLILTLLVFQTTLFAAEPSKKIVINKPTFEPKVEVRVNRAKFYAHKKEYKKAKLAFEHLFNQEKLSEEQKKYLQGEYEKTDVQSIFSVLPDSTVIYTVESGDSLYKIAKKHETTIELIKSLNNLKKDTIIKGEKLAVLAKPISILVDKSDNLLTLEANHKSIREFHVATGTNNITPVGEFKIAEKLENPTWYKPGGKVIAPGVPENGLGSRWLGFNQKSYGIHGTNEPSSIGHQVSHGCIRMLNLEVEELFSIIPIGTKVTIQD